MKSILIETTSKYHGRVIKTVRIDPQYDFDDSCAEAADASPTLAQQERKQAMADITFNTKQQITFKCSYDCEVGAYRFKEGEPLKAVSNGTGKFVLYAEWADGGVGIFSAYEINKLAGYQAVQ